MTIDPKKFESLPANLNPETVEAMKLAKYGKTERTQSHKQSSTDNISGRGGDKYIRQNGENSKMPDALFGDLDPITSIPIEKPEHRLMADMKVQGYNNREIAAFTGYTDHHVSDVLRQPHIRERILNGIKKNTQEEIKRFLEAEVLPSLEVIKT